MTSESSAYPGPAAVDPFFQLVPGGKFNACIGRQGSEEDYVDGYIEVAQELVAAVVDKEQLGKAPTSIVQSVAQYIANADVRNAAIKGLAV